MGAGQDGQPTASQMLALHRFQRLIGRAAACPAPVASCAKVGLCVVSQTGAESPGCCRDSCSGMRGWFSSRPKVKPLPCASEAAELLSKEWLGASGWYLPPC